MDTNNNNSSSTEHHPSRWVDSPASSSNSLSSSNSSSLARHKTHSVLRLRPPPQPVPLLALPLPIHLQLRQVPLTHSPPPLPLILSEVVVLRSSSPRTPGPSSMRMMTRLSTLKVSECQRKRSKNLQPNSPQKRQLLRPRLTPSSPTRADLQASSS